MAADGGDTLGVLSLRGRYSQLLLSLVALGLLYPALEEGVWGKLIWNVVYWVVLMTTMRACGGQRARRVAWVLLFAALALSAAILWLLSTGAVEVPRSLMLAGSLVQLSFFALTGVTILGDVLSGSRVDVQRIYGAVCFYLLLGVGWAQVYGLVEAFEVDAFAGLKPLPAGVEHRQDSSELLYFSFVTLTTLGYGDIRPIGSFARLFSSAEAIIGQLYLTILVARLVGLHISQAGLERDRS